MKIIRDNESLLNTCIKFSCYDYITVDTEFLRESTFWPQLCLIQMANIDDAVIIDTLAPGLDLKPFFNLMVDLKVKKVFHAARQDIEIIYHLSGIIPAPIFDTQIAAAVCGYGDYISYDHLAYKMEAVRLNKSIRSTDWAKRPLTKAQLNYAISDVTYLRDIYQKLQSSLTRQNRNDWMEEEMKVLTSISTYQVIPEEAWKRLKIKVRNSRELAIMQSVARWREKQAQYKNVPRNRVIKDEVIYEIVNQCPVFLKDLRDIRRLPKGFDKSKCAQGLLEAVKTGLSIPEDQLPHIPKPKKTQKSSGAIFDMMKVLLNLTAEKHQVAARIIATTSDLKKIITDDNPDVAALRGWRRELFGSKALKMKSGKIALVFDGHDILTVNLTPDVLKIVDEIK